MFKKFGEEVKECNCELKTAALTEFVELNSDAIKEENGVLELTDKTFKIAMRKY